MKSPSPDIPDSTDQPFPFLGYVVLNALVWGLLVLAYLAAKRGYFSSVSPLVERPGTAAVLLMVGLSFSVASIFDFLYEKIRLKASRKKAEEISEPQERAQ